MRKNLVGAAVQRNCGVRGTKDAEEDREGGTVKYGPNDGIDAYCATKYGRGGEEISGSGMWEGGA